MTMDRSAILRFAEDLAADLRYEAEIDGAQAMVPEVLTRRAIETLVDAGALENAVECFHADDSQRGGIEVFGFGIDDDDTLNLVTSICVGSPPSRVPSAQIDRAARRARAFWERCRTPGYGAALEESSDAWDMVRQIEMSTGDIRRVRMFVITDGFARTEWSEPVTTDGIEYQTSVWDIERIWRADSSGGRAEPIEIDFIARFGRPLPAIVDDLLIDEYSAYLAIIPGEWLAAIYDEFGSRLLERNVRAFLQFTGKVNRGMRDTLRTEPARFLAYNNGISATASSVDTSAGPDGALAITRIHDLQIVNGGQTTATVHRAGRLKYDLSSVGVQAKITCVDGPVLEELVPRISEYANSQNKVQLADLSSNDPFHVAIESLSRSVWAPQTAATPRQTKWFYERARGQYQDALNREATPARQRQFKAVHPTSQRFSKVDLATFENTWDQLPHEVSKGAQKNFTAFMVNIASRPSRRPPDAGYFQRAVAKAILFRRTERIVSGLAFGGYRRNIVTYALARLSHATQQRIDLGKIWEQQSVPKEIEAAVADLARIAFSVITASDRGATNVTEWAKRPECWERMKAVPWVAPDAIEPFLVPIGRGSVPAHTATMDGALAEEDPLTAELMAPGGDFYLAVANWAKQTDNLTPWQRRFAYSIGVQLNRGKVLSPKQTPHAKQIRDEALVRGFAWSPETVDA